MKVPLLDLRAQYDGLRDELRCAMDEVCEEQAFILGRHVETFEERMADYCGARFAVGVSSGTDALLAALMALGTGPGDAVITTPYTFFATLGSIARVGATPVLVDIDPVTFNMDAGKAAALLEEWPERFRDLKPKVMMPVHLFGQAADMDPLLDLARQHGLKVIEDAAQAIGSEYPSRDGMRRAGSMGDMGCFSFFPSKNLGGFGDGGLVTCDDPDLAEMLRLMRNHGQKPKYHHWHVGGNFRLDALQAVVLNVKLDHLDEWHTARRRNADRYGELLAGSKIAAPRAVYAGSGVEHYHIYNQYVVRMADRDSALERLRTAGIGCAVYYPIPLHLQECFRDLGYSEGDFPVSEAAARETLALPVYPELTKDMQQTVVKTLLNKA